MYSEPANPSSSTLDPGGKSKIHGGVLSIVFVLGTVAGATGDQLQAYFQNSWAIGTGANPRTENSHGLFTRVSGVEALWSIRSAA